jgi:hypothetical protein
MLLVYRCQQDVQFKCVFSVNVVTSLFDFNASLPLLNNVRFKLKTLWTPIIKACKGNVNTINNACIEQGRPVTQDHQAISKPRKLRESDMLQRQPPHGIIFIRNPSKKHDSHSLERCDL